jgi:hypothetical protein
MNLEVDMSFFTLNGTWLALYLWELLAKDALIESSGSGFRGFTLEQLLQSLLKRQTVAFSPAIFQELDGHLYGR